MDLKKKVLVVLDRQEKSLSDLAGLLNMTPQSLNTIFVKGNPRKSTVEKIAAALKVSPDFLMAEAVKESSLFRQAKIPIYEAEASAGRGCVNETEAVENYLMIDRDIIRGELQCNPDNLAIIRVRGDSMTPTIKTGEMVVIDKTVKTVISDGLYIMRLHDDVLVVKRVQALPGGKLNIISDNKAYPSYQVDLSEYNDLAVCGRVMAIISMERVGA